MGKGRGLPDSDSPEVEIWILKGKTKPRKCQVNHIESRVLQIRELRLEQQWW